MSLELRSRILAELNSLILIDPHTHINALAPASTTLADILGYHYYTELAHSAGLPREQIENSDLEPRDKVRLLIENLAAVDNTVQYGWFVEICQTLLGFQEERITQDNWEALYDHSVELMAGEHWSQQVLEKSRLQAVFLTNDFDDPLEGFDTATYIPCLRTDDLVFHLAQDKVRTRLEHATGISVTDLSSLRAALTNRFDHFTRRGARACAISLPPNFSPRPVSDGRAGNALEAVLAKGEEAEQSHLEALAQTVF